MIDGIKNKDDLYFCHEQNEKKRCPICGSIETKKSGFIYGKILTSRGKIKRKTQRFICKSCRTSFTNQGFNIRKKVSDELKRQSVIDYVTTKGSLADIARMKGFSKMAILNWLEEVASSFQEVEKTLSKEGWSGYIQLDGKEVSIKKKKKTVFIATDSKNGKIISYGVYDKEDKYNSLEFLRRIKGVYPCKVIGVTSDFGRGKCFISVIKKVFPNAKHQICLVHYQRYMWLFIPRTKRSRYFWRNLVLKWMIKKVITANTREESLFWLNEFIKRRAFFKADYHTRFVKSVIRNYEYLTAYYDDLELVNNSNISENINRQLERKLKNTDGFKKEVNLKNFLKIWFSYYKK